MTLVSDLATAYFNLLELDEELDIAQRTLATREESLRVIQTRQNRGLATMLDVRQAEQLVQVATEAIPTIQEGIEQTENQISLLIGGDPGPIGRSLGQQQSTCRSGRIAFGAAGSPPRHPRGGTEPGCRECYHRRGEGCLLPADQPHRPVRISKQSAFQPVQRTDRGLAAHPTADAVGLRGRNESSPVFASRKRSSRLHSCNTSEQFGPHSGKWRTLWFSTGN